MTDLYKGLNDYLAVVGSELDCYRQLTCASTRWSRLCARIGNMVILRCCQQNSRLLVRFCLIILLPSVAWAESLTVQFDHLIFREGTGTMVCFLLAAGAAPFEDYEKQGVNLMIAYPDATHTSCTRVFATTASLQLDNISTGNYAIRAFQDINNNGVLDANLLGIPKEPIATSGQAGLGAPTFAQSMFTVEVGEDTSITLQFK